MKKAHIHTPPSTTIKIFSRNTNLKKITKGILEKNAHV
jgi:hypothetical protein